MLTGLDEAYKTAPASKTTTLISPQIGITSRAPSLS